MDAGQQVADILGNTATTFQQHSQPSPYHQPTAGMPYASANPLQQGLPRGPNPQQHQQQSRPPLQPRGPTPQNMVHKAPPPPMLAEGPPRQMSRGQSKEEEDTMKNLRKTFAGLFGNL